MMFFDRYWLGFLKSTLSRIIFWSTSARFFFCQPQSGYFFCSHRLGIFGWRQLMLCFGRHRSWLFFDRCWLVFFFANVSWDCFFLYWLGFFSRLQLRLFFFRRQPLMIYDIRLFFEWHKLGFFSMNIDQGYFLTNVGKGFLVRLKTEETFWPTLFRIFWTMSIDDIFHSTSA